MLMGKQLKRLSNYDDVNAYSEGPFTPAEMIRRHTEYNDLSSKDFKKKYRSYIYKPAYIVINGEKHEILLNCCHDPFCKWFGLPQQRYTTIKSSPSRYKLTGKKANEELTMVSCCDVADTSIPGVVANSYSYSISNWSVAEEILRLIKINSISPLKSEYVFHRNTCLSNLDPFKNPEQFYKRGKSTSNSQKYQCKGCKKITNVLPEISGRFNYNQTLDGILLDFAKDIISRMAVKRTCEKLGIGSNTYYNKLEILYRRCLEFNELHETETFKKIKFEEIMLNTDSMIYHLNDVRLKGKGKDDIPDEIDQNLQTTLIATTDVKTGYALRADIAYDYDYSLDSLEIDTEAFHCDATYSFLRKNQRFPFPFVPKFTKNFSTTESEKFYINQGKFKRRQNYVKGCHVRSNYTMAAHIFMIKKMVNSKKWYFVTDDDTPTKGIILRIYKEEVRNKNAHYFVCQYEKGLSLQEAGTRSFLTRIMLDDWAKDNGFEDFTIIEKARQYLTDYIDNNEIYEYYPGTKFPKQCIKPIKHPLPTKSEGERNITLKTDMTDLSSEDLAKIISTVSNVTIDNFFQELRRRVNLLERPLVTARGDGKSYIYANANPKYAQYLLTIFRTFYNFCWTKETFGKRLTPAQKIGIAKKVYKIEDIIYFK